MAETEGLKVKISADSEDFEKEADKVVSKTKSVASTIMKIMAGVGLVALLKSSANRFAEAEKAAFRFTSAMKQMEVPKKVINSLDEFANKLEKIYGISKVELQSAFATMTRLIGSGGPVDKLKEAIAEMAIATGQSFEGVATIISRAMTIGLSSLRRYGIVATAEQERVWNSFGDDMNAKADFLNDILKEKFGGAIDGYGQTAVAANERVKQAFQNLQVQLGQQVLPLFTGLLRIVTAVSKAMGGLGTIIGIVAAIWVAAAVIKTALLLKEGKEVDGLILRYLALGLAHLWAINPWLAITVGVAAMAAMAGIIFGIVKGIQAIGFASMPNTDFSDESKNKGKDDKENENKTPIVNNITINQDNMGDYNAKTQNINGTKTYVQTK